MNDAAKVSKRKRKDEGRKGARAARELYRLRARDLKGKPRLYPKPEQPKPVQRTWDERGPK